MLGEGQRVKREGRVLGITGSMSLCQQSTVSWGLCCRQCVTLVVTLKTDRHLRMWVLFSPFCRYGNLTLERGDIDFVFGEWYSWDLNLSPPFTHTHILAASGYQKSC